MQILIPLIYKDVFYDFFPLVSARTLLISLITALSMVYTAILVLFHKRGNL